MKRELNMLRESISKENMGSFVGISHRQRQLNREKQLQMLPINMSNEVETAKAFGGKNALLHMKLQNHRKAKRNASNYHIKNQMCTLPVTKDPINALEKGWA